LRNRGARNESGLHVVEYECVECKHVEEEWEERTDISLGVLMARMTGSGNRWIILLDDGAPPVVGEGWSQREALEFAQGVGIP